MTLISPRGARAGSTATLLAAAVLCTLATADAGEFKHPVPATAPIIASYSFRINYSVASSPQNRPVRVEFFMTEDMGATWRRYGEDGDLVSPMNVRVDRDGVFGFVSVATDARGNREREPVTGTRPESVVIVDRRPPTVQWLKPAEGVLVQPEVLEFKWLAEDENIGSAPVTLEASHDNGQTWAPIAVDLPAAGEYAWRPTDGSGSVQFRLTARDLAGNTTVRRAPATLVLDNTPPTVRLMGPEMSGTLETPIEYQARDETGGAGLRDVTLYATYDDGRSWQRGAVSPEPGTPIPFVAERPGRIGLMAVARDHALNHSPIPHPHLMPPFYLVVDTEPPVVTLSDSFLYNRGLVPAGELRYLEWSAESPTLDPYSAKLSLSTDDGQTWRPITDRREAARGRYQFQFPLEDVPAARIQVEVSNRFGNIGRTESRTFRIEKPNTVVQSFTDRVSPANAITPIPIEGASATHDDEIGPVPVDPPGTSNNLAPFPNGMSGVGPTPFQDIFNGAGTGGAPSAVTETPAPRSASIDESSASVFPHTMVEQVHQAIGGAPAALPGLPEKPAEDAGSEWDKALNLAPPSPSLLPSTTPTPPEARAPSLFDTTTPAPTPSLPPTFESATPGMGIPALGNNTSTPAFPDFNTPPALPGPGTASPSTPAASSSMTMPAFPSLPGPGSSTSMATTPAAPSSSEGGSLTSLYAGANNAAGETAAQRLQRLQAMAFNQYQAGTAATELRQLAASQPGDAAIQIALATAYHTAREYTLAAQAALTATQIDPRDWYARLLLGNIYCSHATALNTQAEQAAAASLEYAGLQQERDIMIGRAKDELELAKRLNPDNKHVHLRLGDAVYLESQALRNRAEQAFLRSASESGARAVTPDMEDRAREAGLAQAAAKLREAATHYRRAFEMPPIGYQESFSLGRIHFWLQEDEQAKEYLLTAIENAINIQGEEVRPSEAYHTLGIIYLGQNDFPKALEALEMAKRLYDPNNVSVPSVDAAIAYVRDRIAR